MLVIIQASVYGSIKEFPAGQYLPRAWCQQEAADVHRRFRDANPEEIEALTLEGMREAVMAQLNPANVEINFVGDIDPAEVDDIVLRYLGTVAPREAPQQQLRVQPPGICYPPPHIRRQAWHLKARPLTLAAVQAIQSTGF